MRLVGIATKAKRRDQMHEVDTAEIGINFGVKGDYRGRPGWRQITVLSQDSWNDACQFIGNLLPWTIRRANLLITGRRFCHKDIGRIISIGEVELRITRETDPCNRMNDAHPGLKDALAIQWRGGVCCRVQREGLIEVGYGVQIS